MYSNLVTEAVMYLTEAQRFLSVLLFYVVLSKDNALRPL